MGPDDWDADDAALELVLGKLDDVRSQRGYWTARCPAHDDNKPSLDIKRGTEQPVLLICRANCDTADILSVLGLTMADICAPREQRDEGEWTPRGPAVAVYHYRDEKGVLLFDVCRTAGKEFPGRVPDPLAKSGWRWRLGDTRRVLYRLPELLAALDEGGVIWVCEGERDVDRLWAEGVPATCNPHGAGKWLPEFAEVFTGAIVSVIADCDAPGRAHARAVARSLEPVAAAVEIREAAAGKDVSDHLNAGKTLAELVTTQVSDGTDPMAGIPLVRFLAIPDDPQRWVIKGLLERGDRLILTGGEGLGKALNVQVSVPTPKGWTTMGALAVGDEVFGPDGAPARVVAATDVMTGRSCYRVVFSDGTEIIADGDHSWLTETLACRRREAQQRKRGELKPRGTDQRHKRQHFPAVVTTREIAATLMARNGHAVNHSVEVCAPLQYPAQELPVDPYLLGQWLGNGSRGSGQITSHEDDGGHVAAAATAAGYPVSVRPMPGKRCVSVNIRKLARPLADLGVLTDKHIPEIYQRASVPQRLALLAGLMDSDGTVGREGGGSGRGEGAATCEFQVTCEPLARGAHELLLGLGIKVTWRDGTARLYGRDMGPKYRLAFQTDLPVFRLPRKAARLAPLRTRRAKLRYITACDPVPSVPVRCIEVDRADGMFLAGRECIPTHNSTMTRQLAVAGSVGIQPFTGEVGDRCRVMFMDCENSERKSRRRFRPFAQTAALLHRPLAEEDFLIYHLQRGIDLTKEEWRCFLWEQVTAYRPDMLVIGPLWKLHAVDANEELAARAILDALDHVLEIADCAIVTEAHMAKGPGGPGRRLEPAGSRAFLGWPDQGYGIKVGEGGSFKRVRMLSWRGDREEREWPRELVHGQDGREWPWVVPDQDPGPEGPRWTSQADVQAAEEDRQQARQDELARKRANRAGPAQSPLPGPPF